MFLKMFIPFLKALNLKKILKILKNKKPSIHHE